MGFLDDIFDSYNASHNVGGEISYMAFRAYVREHGYPFGDGRCPECLMCGDSVRVKDGYWTEKLHKKKKKRHPYFCCKRHAQSYIKAHRPGSMVAYVPVRLKYGIETLGTDDRLRQT
jgi:hypothetical protein